MQFWGTPLQPPRWVDDKGKVVAEDRGQWLCFSSTRSISFSLGNFARLVNPYIRIQGTLQWVSPDLFYRVFQQKHPGWCFLPSVGRQEAAGGCFPNPALAQWHRRSPAAAPGSWLLLSSWLLAAPWLVAHVSPSVSTTSSFLTFGSLWLMSFGSR